MSDKLYFYYYYHHSNFSGQWSWLLLYDDPKGWLVPSFVMDIEIEKTLFHISLYSIQLKWKEDELCDLCGLLYFSKTHK